MLIVQLQDDNEVLKGDIEELTNENQALTSSNALLKEEIVGMKNKNESKETYFITTIQGLNKSINEVEEKYNHSKEDFEEEKDKYLEIISNLESKVLLYKQN